MHAYILRFAEEVWVRLFLGFWLIMNALAFLVMREALPFARARRFAAGFFAAALLSLTPWGALAVVGWRALDDAFGAATAAVWTVSIAWQVAVAVLVCGWPVWRVLLSVVNHKASDPRMDPQRRALLRRVGLLVPAGAVGFSAAGVAASGMAPYVRRLELWWPDLHPGLDGFRIGQFSDVHVGPFVSPRQVVAGIEALNAEAVDLMVMTGDLHDDNAFMPSLSEAFLLCKARHGLIGCLGNHEYYAGLDDYLRHVEGSAMRLLIDEGTVLEHGGARLHVSGVDYPFRGMDGPSEAAAESMKLAMRGGAGADFRLCLAHHPTCWDEARKHGVHLTLSGHTHGGQVAVGGRSVFRRMFRYMLGLYEEGQHRLYVTGGLGHWFPFRLGCPPEVVVVELKRGHAPPV